MKKLNCIMTAFIVFILQSAVLPFMFNGVSQPNLILSLIHISEPTRPKR